MTDVLLFLSLVAFQAPQAPLDRTVPVGSATMMHVHGQVGRIEVRAGATDQVRVRSNTAFVVDRDGTTLSVRATDTRTVQEVSFVVEIPALMQVRTTSRFSDVTVTGIRAAIQVDAREGSVTVTGGEGTVVVRSVSGDVTVTSRSGDVSVSSSTSNITLKDATGAIKLDTTSGAVNVTGGRISGGEAQTVSGDIRFTSAIAAGSRYSFSTHTGAIAMTLADQGATITTYSAQGVLHTTPAIEPKSVEPGRLSKRVYQVGDGGAVIELRTLDGRLSLDWNRR